MDTQQIKRVITEKRQLSIGDLTDELISGNLRRELCMSKDSFSQLICVRRGTIRRVEGFEVTPSMKMVLNTAAALRIGIIWPECGNIEVVPRRNNKNKDEK